MRAFQTTVDILNYIITRYEQHQILYNNSEMNVFLENVNELVCFKIIVNGQMVLHLCTEEIFKEFLKTTPNISVKFVVAKMLSITTLKNHYNNQTKENHLNVVSETFSSSQEKKFEIILNFKETQIVSCYNKFKALFDKWSIKYKKFLTKIDLTKFLIEKVGDLSTGNEEIKNCKELSRLKSIELSLIGFQKMLEQSGNFQNIAYELLQTDNEHDTLQSIKTILYKK